MEAASPEEIRHHFRRYMMIFAALAGFTVITVVVSWLNVPTTMAILIALCIALCKGTLVGAYFMHLISERKALFTMLGLCVVFFFTLLLVPMWTSSEMRGSPHISTTKSPALREVDSHAKEGH